MKFFWQAFFGAYRNKQALKYDKTGICLACGKENKYEDIKSWEDDGETAVCAGCNRTLVIPEGCIPTHDRVRFLERVKKTCLN